MRGKLALFLLIVVFTSFIAGCEDNSGDNGEPAFVEETLVEEIVTANKTSVVKFDGGIVTIPLGAFDGEDTLKVSVLKSHPEPEGAKILKGFDIDLEIHKSLKGYAEIEFEYQGSGNVAALVYNESSGEWEGILHHVENGKVIIYTNHFSRFALASVNDETGPMAKVRYPSSLNGISLKESEAIAVLQEYMNNGYQPGPNAYRVGWDTAVEVLGLEAQPLTFAQHVFGMKVLERINNGITYIGVGIAVVQLGLDLYSGDMTTAGLNFIKNSIYSYVGLYGSPLLQLKFIGVFLIDYFITKLQSFALTTEEQQWKKLHDLYYNTKMKRTAKDWYDIFWRIYKESQTDSPEEIKRKINKEIDNYVNSFWKFVGTEEYYAWVVGHVNIKQASQAWATEQIPHVDVKNKLIENHRAELLYTLQPVFRALSKNAILEEEKEVFKNLKKIRKELNRVYAVNVHVFGPRDYVKGLKVYIPVESGDQEQWTKILDEDGEARFTFTMYGFLKSGAENKVVLELENGEKMEEEFKFESWRTVTSVGFDLGGKLSVDVKPKKVTSGGEVDFRVCTDPPIETKLQIEVENEEKGVVAKVEKYTSYADNGCYYGSIEIPEEGMEGMNYIKVVAPAIDASGSASFEVIKAKILVKVSPQSIEPGEVVKIIADVYPPGVYTAKIQVTNVESGAKSSVFTKNTDSKGHLVYRLQITERNVEQKLGGNLVRVWIDELGVVGTAYFYVGGAPAYTPTYTPTYVPTTTYTPTYTPTPTPSTTPESAAECPPRTELRWWGDGRGYCCVSTEGSIIIMSSEDKPPCEEGYKLADLEKGGWTCIAENDKCFSIDPSLQCQPEKLRYVPDVGWTCS